MKTTWEVKFKGDFSSKTIVASDFDAAYKLVRQLEPNKEIVSISYLVNKE